MNALILTHIHIYKKEHINTKDHIYDILRTEQDEQLKYCNKLYINSECCVESMFHEYS